MTWQRKKVSTNQIQAVAFCFVLFVLMVTAVASEDYDFEGVWRDLEKVQAYYEKRKYKKAGSLLAKVRDKVYDTPEWGMEYPENIRRQIAILDSLISDAQGEFESYPKFRGKIIEQAGNVGGYVVVQGAKEKRTFFYEKGLIISYEKKSRKTGSQANSNKNNAFGVLEYTKGLEGKSITVYYDEDSPYSSPLAVKILVHK